MVEVVSDPQPMYNLTVADAHTFFVGDGQWLVHNTDCVIQRPYPDRAYYEAIDTELPIERDLNVIASGEMSVDGYMEFAIYTKNHVPPTKIRGGEAFSKLADELIRNHTPVNGVRGLWSGSDNLDAFNRNLAAGYSLIDSARQTFTGNMSGKYGFHRVTIESIIWASKNVASSVTVLFER